MKKNLSMMFTGISLFVSTNAAHLFPLSVNSILIDHNEYFKVDNKQNLIIFTSKTVEKHFDWNNHSFTLLTLKTPIVVSSYLSNDQLPKDLVKLIYDKDNKSKTVNPYIQKIKVFNEISKKEISCTESELETITSNLNRLIDTDQKALASFVNLKENGYLDDKFLSYFYNVIEYPPTGNPYYKYTFLCPSKYRTSVEMKIYLKHLNQLIIQRTQLLEAFYFLNTDTNKTK